MSRGRRMAAVIAVIAAILLLGRSAAILSVDSAWYHALLAQNVWRARWVNAAWLYGGAIVVGSLFAFANFFAVRRSIVALVVPTRLGNVEFGEEIPGRRLVAATMLLSIVAAAISTFALPSWTVLAIWRSGVNFGESDPYFGLDLRHYTAWLPLEIGVYVWAMILFTIVSIVVIGLYALTPSLRWARSGVRVTAYVRRHLSVLAALLVLFIAWGFRIDAFNTLVTGSGVDGAFTRIDHQWIMPANLLLSVATIGAAVVLLATGWVGQTPAAFVTLTVVLVCALVTKLLLPWIARVSADNPINAAIEAPYAATQRAFTARAFAPEADPPSMRFAVDSAMLAAAPSLRLESGLRDAVYPGARGVVVEPDSARQLFAPRLGGFGNRLLNAWAEQTPLFFRKTLDDRDAIVRTRDVRERVRAIAPIFMQSRAIGARPASDGIVWIVDLYATSDKYPLSSNKHVGSTLVSYRRHAGTAYVNGMTGAVTIVRDTASDPISDAWFRSYGDAYLASAPPAIVPVSGKRSAKTGTTGKHGVTPVTPDTMFRMKVLSIYLRMRAALDSGNFRTFGDAFDSLGTTIGVQR